MAKSIASQISRIFAQNLYAFRKINRDKFKPTKYRDFYLHVEPHFSLYFVNLAVIPLGEIEEVCMKADNEKRTKFVKLAEGRVQAALTAIRKIGNLANRRSYEFGEADIKKITKALREAVTETERKFDPGSSAPGQKSFKL